MPKLPVTLAEPARAWIDSQVAAGAAPDADSYLAALIERDRQQASKRQAFDTAIDEGLASGFVEISIDDVFIDIRRRHAAA
ncbi:hypothetical protein GCM10007973_26260 [Polymorphobacter multimanifer]|nr:hypothetical protein GCM10007973_26260 [Polymorphobacter multimanifer]